MSATEKQPLKGLYVAGAAFGIVVSLPYYLAKYAFPGGRQRTGWTFQQALLNTLGRAFLYHSSTVRVKTPLDFEPRDLDGRLVTVQPSESAKYAGVLASKADVQPAPFPAVWFPATPSSFAVDQRVILHFHGGCFVLLDARPADTAFCAETLAQAFAAPVLMISYRLASNPGGAFPAALQDALSAYLHLLASGVTAANIIVSGDSAGANIVLGLLRYLYSEEGKHATGGALPPGAALLWSPWVDIASARTEPERIDAHRNASTDYLTGHYVHWGATSIGTGQDVRSPYLTSLGHPFACPKTKLWYQIGGAEILADEGSQSAREMTGIPGNVVDMWVEENANHDIIMGGGVSGFAAEAKRSARKAREFIEG